MPLDVLRHRILRELENRSTGSDAPNRVSLPNAVAQTHWRFRQVLGDLRPDHERVTFRVSPDEAADGVRSLIQSLRGDSLERLSAFEDNDGGSEALTKLAE